MNQEITPIVNNFRNRSKADKLRERLTELAGQVLLTTENERLINNNRKLFEKQLKSYDDKIEVLSMKFKKEVEQIHDEKEKVQCEAMQREIDILEHRHDDKIK